MILYSTILLIGLVQGFFLTLGLLIKHYGKKKRNYYFLGLVFLISVSLLSKFLFSPARYQQFPQLWFIPDTIAYFVGPLWYFTIQKSIKPSVKLSLNDWLLLSPILYQIGFLGYIFTLEKSSLFDMTNNPFFAQTFFVFCLGVLITNGGFLWKAHRTLQKHRDVQFPELLRKGQLVFIFIIAIWLLSFVFSLILTNTTSINLNAYSFAFLSLAFLTFGLAFLALIKPASFYFLTQTYDSSQTYVLQQIAEQVEIYLKEQEPYLKSNFSLNELSQAIGSNPVLTSKAINRILKSTFSDLMNEYRVQHFLRLAKKEKLENLTLFAIAQEAGFGNKVTFYKSFKKVMGMTPKTYLLEFEKFQ